MNRNKRIKEIADKIYDDYIANGWKNVSLKDCELKAINYIDTEAIVKKLTLTDVSQQRELLVAFVKWQQNQWLSVNAENVDNTVDTYLSN